MNNDNITAEEFTRLANNFYNSKNVEVDFNRVGLDSHLLNYVAQNTKAVKENKYKVAFVFICLNPLYWQYAREMVRGAKQFFLPGHEVDYFFWTDIPDKPDVVKEKIIKAFKERGVNTEENATNIQNILNGIADLRTMQEIKIIETEAVEWPYPTLLRYNLFLQEEERLKEYDYIFYSDIDMRFVNIVGDEILGEITAAQHPMYALRKEYWPPYEPNENSASYIKRPGKIVVSNVGVKRFMPLYFAGGFQGGKATAYLEAMKATKKLIEKDMNKNYIPIWNDETAWNKYLAENPPEIVLSPSYIYPDSLINEYYVPLWGCNYQPKLMTLTKWFSVSREGGEAVQKMIKR